MSREKQPNQRKASRAHHERTDQLVERIIDQLSIGATEEAMRLISLVDLSRVDEFRFRDFPTFKRLVEEMKRSYAQRLRLGLISAQKSEWDESWAMQDLLVSKALRSYGINGKQGGKIEISLSEQRDSALRSFLKRREQGMNLSERVWHLSGEHQTLLERSIATALKHGSSFAQLSREVLRYLRDYPRLESEYRQAFGKKLDIGNIRYQAQRLARTEINMAYRSAESSRWQELDFVVGYEVKRSQRNERRKVKDPKTGRTKTVVINSDCPVCDALKGRYPKDFKWTAWHPNCRCYAVPILSSREDFLRGEDPKKSANAVTELPQGFKDWVKDNEGRIATASHRGTLPYFLRDNQGKWQSLVGATAQTQTQVSAMLSVKYPKEQWEHTYIAPNGGYVVTELQRIKEGKRNSTELKKYLKEKEMASIYANQGNEIQHLQETDREIGKTYDVLFNGIPAELKSFKGAGAMIEQISDAIRKQGAEVILVRFENTENKLLDKLKEARRKFKSIRILYYWDSDKIVHELF